MSVNLKRAPFDCAARNRTRFLRSNTLNHISRHLGLNKKRKANASRLSDHQPTPKHNPFPDISTHWLGYGARCRCSRIPRSTMCRFFPAFAAKNANFRFCASVWRIPKVVENVASRGGLASIDILRTELCRLDYLKESFFLNDS